MRKEKEQAIPIYPLQESNDPTGFYLNPQTLSFSDSKGLFIFSSDNPLHTVALIYYYCYHYYYYYCFKYSKI